MKKLTFLLFVYQHKKNYTKILVSMGMSIVCKDKLL